MRVKTNCSIDAGPGGSSAYWITKAFHDLGHTLTLEYEKTDLVINVGGMPHVNREPDTPFFFWDCDSFMHDPNESTLEFDKIFIGGSPEDLTRYPEGTVYLPHAFDEDTHKPYDVKKEFDVVMIGNKSNIYEKRNRAVAILKDHFTVYHEQAPFGEEYSKAMSMGKLIFNMTLGEKNIPIRFFEGMAIGCLLENYNDNLDSLATEGTHYIGYTDENMVDKIRHYLDHPELIEKIAKAGRKHALKHHTYKHRVKEILKYV